jgi:hypothetical protein
VVPFLFLISITVFANDFKLNKETGKVIPSHAGEVKIVKGDVQVKNQDGLNSVEQGARLKVNDVVVTQDKSFAKIQMVDDSVFTIGPNSEVKIEKFDYFDKNDRKMLINFLKGQMKGLIKNKAKAGDLNLKTNLAVMGIRGTEFLMNHHKEEKVEISEIAVIEGNVEVIDEKNDSLTLTPPQKVVFVKNLSSGVAIKEDKKLTSEEISAFKDEESFMNYYNLSNVDKDSSFYQLVKKVFGADREIMDAPNTESEGQKPQGNWRDNLDKLTEKLKEYNK